MINELLDVIASHGDRGAVVPFSRIYDLKNDMLALKSGEYHTDWINRMAKHMSDDANLFVPADINFELRSLILVVIPSPKATLQFNHNSKIYQCVLPPVATERYVKEDEVLSYIEQYLAPLGFSVAKAATITQKLLAVHCGLGLYGRNNICYNNEFGSYMLIMTYISDLFCDDATWFPVRRMEICENCYKCVDACPTKAIETNRLLLDSDKCVTYYNEIPGVFPDWLGEDVHNCIVGCMKCQDCCPANSRNENNIITGLTFTEAETKELLNNKGDLPYTDSLAAKIKATGILQEFAKSDVLSRNLNALMRNTTQVSD